MTGPLPHLPARQETFDFVRDTPPLSTRVLQECQALLVQLIVQFAKRAKDESKEPR